MSETREIQCRGKSGGLGVIIPLSTTAALAADTVGSVDTAQDGGGYTVADHAVLFPIALHTGPIPTLTYAEPG